jgi:hypothetical protein
MINGLGGLRDLRPFASLCNTEAQNSSRTPLGQLIFLAVALHRGLAINGLRPAGIAHGSYGSGVYGTQMSCTVQQRCTSVPMSPLTRRQCPRMMEHESQNETPRN